MNSLFPSILSPLTDKSVTIYGAKYAFCLTEKRKKVKKMAKKWHIAIF